MQASSSFNVEGVGLDCETLPKPLDFAALFGNANPVELEIGMGKGTFLTSAALANPNTNYLGLEWANWFARYAADRLRRNGCTNARTARAEAKWFVREFIPDASLSVVHVYFPDPWPKARQKKRRTLKADWMPEIVRVLKPGGELRVVTDHQNYFEEHIRPAVQGSGLTIIDYEKPPTSRDQEMVGTNFERKYILEGRAIYSIAARKS